MSYYSSRYPDGTAGLGLLLLRLSYAPVAFGVAAALQATIPSPHLLHVVAGLIALTLTIGVVTRLAALVLGVAVACAMPASNTVQQLLLAGHVGGCAAIVLIGAGAFSIDAIRHGRRVIHLQSHSPDRGGGD